MRDVAFTLFKLTPTFFLASCFIVGPGPTLRATVWLAALGYGAFVLGRAVLPHLRTQFPQWFAPEPLQMQSLYRPDELYAGRDLESSLHRDLASPPDHAISHEDGRTPFLPGLHDPNIPLRSAHSVEFDAATDSGESTDEPDDDGMFLPGVAWLDARQRGVQPLRREG